MSILTKSIPQNRLNINGKTVSKSKKFEQILELLAIRPMSPSDLTPHVGITRENIQKSYLKPLLEENKIKKVDGTHLYQLAKDNITKTYLLEQLYSKSEIMNTAIFKNWKSNNSAKNEHTFFVTISRLCLGKVNPNFKIHPDMITKDNWEKIIPKMVDAFLKVEKNPKKEPHWLHRQALRHLIIYGLDVNISEEKGIALRISGEKQKPKSGDLRIEKPQVEQAKLILSDSKKYDPVWLCKFGFKTWTFVRPSTIYIVETDSLEFYDRKVEYVKLEGQRQYDEHSINFAKTILSLKPELKDTIKIGSYSHRACTLQVFENKNQTDYRKFIYDEDFVIALEKYWKQRKSEKKKYLFWDDNSTEFTFENYDKIVLNQVGKDNIFFKKLLSELGFKKEDFGTYFRANYGFRHFGLQMWLIATNYNYDLVSEMSHDDTATLKKWYGKQSKDHIEKMFRGVVV